MTESGKTVTQDTVNTGPQTIATGEPSPSQVPAVVKQERRPRAPATPKPPAFPPHIAKAIIAITNAIGVIEKRGENEFQKYRYARWEDIAEVLSPLLAAHGLIIVQTELSRSLLEQNDKGSTLAIVYNFTIVNQDGEFWPPVEWTGIARLRDQKGITDDKAALKCQTAAEKSFCIKQFKIRSSDEDVLDGERRPQRADDERATYQKFLDEITVIEGLDELKAWKQQNLQRVRGALRDKWITYFDTAYNEKRADLERLQQEYAEYMDEQEKSQ